jgi:hypothetical protein
MTIHGKLEEITTHSTVTSAVKWGKRLLLNEEVMHVTMRSVLAITLFSRRPTFFAMWHSVNDEDILYYLSVV